MKKCNPEAHGACSRRSKPHKMDERLPLLDKHVWVTCERRMAETFADKLRSEKACPVVIPMIETVPCEVLIHEPGFLKSFNMIVFTSQNAVRYFFKIPDPTFVRVSGKTEIVCIGRKTAAACRDLGLHVGFVPENPHSALELARELSDARRLKGAKILFPKAKGLKSPLPSLLEGAGAWVEELEVYETHARDSRVQELSSAIDLNPVDWVTFLSPSAAHAFHDALHALDARDWITQGRARIASIGRTTSKTISTLGWSVDVECGEPSTEDMIKMMKTWERSRAGETHL